MPVTLAGTIAGVSAIAVGGVFATLKTSVVTELNKVIALIPNPDAATAPTAGLSGLAPNYDEWHPVVARNMRAELATLSAAITAAT